MALFVHVVHVLVRKYLTRNTQDKNAILNLLALTNFASKKQKKRKEKKSLALRMSQNPYQIISSSLHELVRQEKGPLKLIYVYNGIREK